jgi:transposase
MKRVECVGETLRHALNTLAVVAPAWTREQTPGEWSTRYGARFEERRLPKSKSKRQEYVDQMGADGQQLLEAVHASPLPWLRQIPAIQILREVWIQNFTPRADGKLRWRQDHELPPARMFISSPYDLDAHYSRKWHSSWVGYKVHLTETHDADRPHLITHVVTTTATTPDAATTGPIHQALAVKSLLPSTHTVDTGYIDAELIRSSEEAYQVDLVGPTRQGRVTEGFHLTDFAIDWENEPAVCPAGRTSASWTPATSYSGKPVIKVKFSRRDCGNCRFSNQCTRANPPRRTLTLQPAAQHKALQAARARQQTAEYARQYAKRAGIEGTVSQIVRRCGARRTRYIGLAKTHLQHVLTAAAINLVRVLAWLAGEQPGKTHLSAFGRLHLGPT